MVLTDSTINILLILLLTTTTTTTTTIITMNTIIRSNYCHYYSLRLHEELRHCIERPLRRRRRYNSLPHQVQTARPPKRVQNTIILSSPARDPLKGPPMELDAASWRGYLPISRLPVSTRAK